MRDTTHDILWFIVPFGVFDTHNSHELLYTGLIINNVKCSAEFNWCIIFNFRCESKRRETTCHCRRCRNGLFCSVFLHTFNLMLKYDDDASRMRTKARALRKSINRFVASLFHFCLLFISNVRNYQFKRNCFSLNIHHCTATRHIVHICQQQQNHSKTQNQKKWYFARGVCLSHCHNCQ